MSHRAPVTALAAGITALLVLPLAPPASATPASSAPAMVSPSASDPAVVDLEPTTATLNVRKRHTRFFAASFQAEAGEVRFVATELVVLDAKKTAPNEIFLGVTLSCRSPSGTVTSAEAGRNVWPAASSFVIPVSFTFRIDVAGTYRCQADVMMCNPGNCNSPTGKGVVRIVTQKMNPRSYSLLYVSPALPNWAGSVRVPTGGDRLVRSGASLTIRESFDVSDASGPVEVGGIFSITNCIESDFPAACKRARKPAIRGTATVQMSLALAQSVITPGTRCATATATRATGAGTTRITWQQHHAVFNVYATGFRLVDDPGCGGTVTATVTVKVGKGNAVVVESGSKAKSSSILYAIPGDVVR